MKRKRTDIVEVYRDRRGKWRWRFVSPWNGHNLANGSEGYSRRVDCMRSMRRVTGGQSLKVVTR